MLAIRRATASTVVGCHHHLARGGDPHKLVLGVHRGWNQSSCFGRLQSILPKNMTSSPPQKNCRTTCTCLSFPTTVGAGDMDATGNNVPRNALTLVAATTRATATSSSAALHGFLDWMSRIIATGGNSVFANTSSIWNMSSTLKKRRAKMNKHKLRKRRKRERRKTK